MGELMHIDELLRIVTGNWIYRSIRSYPVVRWIRTWFWRFWLFSWLRFLLWWLLGDLKKVPVESLVNLGAFSYGQEGWHPFTAALKEIDQRPNPDDLLDILRIFYNQFHTSDVSGYLPIHFDPSWDSIKTCYQPPWAGGKIVSDADYFEHWIGPKSMDQCKAIQANLKRVYSTIKTEGYRPSFHPDGWIKICLLEKSSREFRCLVVGGQHRAAVLSHMGYNYVWVRKQRHGIPYPANMGPRIKIREVHRWARVQSGQYTEKDACNFFSSYFEFDGRQQIQELGLPESSECSV